MERKEIKTNFIFTGQEKDIEDHILENLEDISKACGWGEIKRHQRQFTMKAANSRVRADIMIWHENGTGTAIEIKKSKTNRNDLLAAIAQSLYYGVIMEESLSNMPRLVIASNIVNVDLYRIIERFNLPICLLMIDGDRCIYIKN